MRVEWDEEKNLANQSKHGVSFEEAQTLFESGDDYLELFDDAHSETEERFIAIGPIASGVVLVVWAEWPEDVVRIVSARWATPRETDLFRKYMDQST